MSKIYILLISFYIKINKLIDFQLMQMMDIPLDMVITTQLVISKIDNLNRKITIK